MRQHPDKNGGSAAAKAKFQALSVAHLVLSDPARRQTFDETGALDVEETQLSADWCEYWRTLFPKVTEADIEAYSRKYPGSAEEREDVLQAYLDCDGDVAAMLTEVPLSQDEDIARFVDLVDAAVGAGEVEQLPAWPRRRREALARAGPAKRRRKESSAGQSRRAAGEDGVPADLAAAIRGKQQPASQLARARGSQLDALASSLAAKYGAGGADGLPPAPDIPEEAFAAVGRRKEGTPAGRKRRARARRT